MREIPNSIGQNKKVVVLTRRSYCFVILRNIYSRKIVFNHYVIYFFLSFSYVRIGFIQILLWIPSFLKLIAWKNVIKGNEGGKYNKMQINCNILKNKRIICEKRAEYIIYWLNNHPLFLPPLFVNNVISGIQTTPHIM